MKRLGIFVFYNADGIVERYVEVLLESFRDIVNELVIVVNGEVTNEAIQTFQNYTKMIYSRPNKGYDGGAYKDVFLEYLSRDYVKQWDEVLLFNDTFHVVFPWEPVFAKMDEEETDFWGLTAHPGGDVFEKMSEPIPYHLQGYFLACRKKLVMSETFYAFWEQLDYPGSYLEAVFNFEMSFTTYMQNVGYTGVSYVEACGAGYLMKRDKNPYVEKAKELLEELQLPIVKRKFFEIQYFSLRSDVVQVLREKSNYDMELIEEEIRKKETDDRVTYPVRKLCEFCNSHDKIYIYGHGRYGMGVADYLVYKGIDYEGFLVTKKGEEGAENIYQFSEVDLSEKDGVILGLGRGSMQAVYPIVKERLREEQMFLPNF